VVNGDDEVCQNFEKHRRNSSLKVKAEIRDNADKK